MDSTMAAATTLSTPQDQVCRREWVCVDCYHFVLMLQVEGLMRQVAEENGLEVMDQLEQHQVATTRPTISQTTEQEDQLSRR